jgi:hypothetical protein
MRATTLFVAIIAFLAALAAVNATPCTVTSPTCGIIVVLPPTDFIINLSGSVDPATVDASDLTVNGTSADSFIITNGNTTITFHFNTSPVVGGNNIIHIPAGAFDCGPAVDFTCGFGYNGIRPTPPRPPQHQGLAPLRYRARRSMKSTSPLRNKFSVFATTPCRGLSSR